MRVQRAVDMRYGEQIFEVNVPLGDVDLEAPDAMAEIVARFHERHEELYTYATPDQEVVLVNARLAVVGELPALPEEPAPLARWPAAPRRRRRIFLDGWREVAVFDLDAVAPGPLVESRRASERDAARLARDPGLAVTPVWVPLPVALSQARYVGVGAIALGVLVYRAPQPLATAARGLRIAGGELSRDVGRKARGLWSEERGYLLALLAIVGTGIEIRLWLLGWPMRHDESYTYLAYARHPLVLGLTKYDTPNNHLFHTVLAPISYVVFGKAPWALRLPPFRPASGPCRQVTWCSAPCTVPPSPSSPPRW